MKISTCHHLSLWKSRLFIMKISTFYHENFYRPIWTSRPLNMKMSTFHHKNLEHSLWNSRLFIMKISTVHHENLDRSSRKSRPFIMKISTIRHENLDCSSWKSRPFIMKISTIHYENLDRSSWKFRPFIMKISTVCYKTTPVHNEISTFGQNGVPNQRSYGTFISVQSKILWRRKKIVWSSIFYSKEWRKAIIHRTNVLILFNNTHRGKLRFIQFSTRMASELFHMFA